MRRNVLCDTSSKTGVRHRGDALLGILQVAAFRQDMEKFDYTEKQLRSDMRAALHRYKHKVATVPGVKVEEGEDGNEEGEDGDGNAKELPRPREASAEEGHKAAPREQLLAGAIQVCHLPSHTV